MIPVIALSNLLFRTRTSVKQAAQIIARAGLTCIEHNGQELITRDDMLIFLDELEKERPPRFHPLPRFLADPHGEPWREALRMLYTHKVAFPACMSPEQGQLLHSVVLNAAPKFCLEIGTFVGCSTLWIASALEEIGEGRITCVDLFADILPFPYSNAIYMENPLGFVRNTLKDAGLAHRVSFRAADSAAVGQQYAEMVSEPMDFLLIDGDHTVEGTTRDFALFEPHVRVGGYIVFHDTNPASGCEGPRHVLDTLVSPERFECLCCNTRPLDYGMAILRKLA